MVHSLIKILLIIEGEGDENKFFKRISKLTSGNKTEFNFFVYKTNIYQLYKELKEYDFDVDIENLLRQNKRNTEKEKECLNNKFAYKYLIFDFDYQESGFDEKQIILNQLMNYFYDETENGKILLNYPMMESYRDMKFVGDLNYFNTTIDICDLNSYKQIVGDRDNSIDIKRYLWTDFLELAKLNVIKANILINNKSEKGTYQNYLSSLNQLNILNKQFDYIEKYDSIFILNCGIFFLIDYFGQDIFNKLI